MDYVVTIKERQGDSYRYGEIRLSGRARMRDVLDDIEEGIVEDEWVEWGEWIHPDPEGPIMTVMAVRAIETT